MQLQQVQFMMNIIPVISHLLIASPLQKNYFNFQITIIFV